MKEKKDINYLHHSTKTTLTDNASPATGTGAYKTAWITPKVEKIPVEQTRSYLNPLGGTDLGLYS